MVFQDRQTTASSILAASFPLLLFFYVMWATDINEFFSIGSVV